MRIFKADLHIHSCLSPCGDLDMSPRAIVEEGLKRGLDVIAVSDHNTAENVGAVMRAGASRGLHVLAAMEVNSSEEVHILALFDTEWQALSLQEEVYTHLKGTNRPELFGDQVVANEFDEVEGFNDRMLIGATSMGIRKILETIHALGGLGIASHVDRPSFSLLSQLGFIPPDLDLDALEISANTPMDSVSSRFPEVKGLPLVTFSDAHFPGDVGSRYTPFLVEAPRVEEIAMALGEIAGRRVAFPGAAREEGCD
ncbi:MAG: PHP domain-containing protein [Deltaproteobacteria bacterium]|nr:PHP domain-containing protein [Deltaproteobacteria bacterium]